MADSDDSGGGPVGLLMTAIASVALFRSAAAAPSAEEQQPRTRPMSDDPLALAEALSVPEPESGPKRWWWRFDRYQREHPWLGIPMAVVKKFTADNGPKLSALIAYFGLFSIFPLMLAFTSILGFVIPDVDQQRRFADAAASQIPVVGGIVQKQAGRLEGNAVLVAVGLGVALWSGLKVIDAMQYAMNTVWDIPPALRPNIIRRRARSMLMLVILGGGIIASVVASGLATYLSFIPGAGRVGIWAASAGVSVLLYFLAFQVLTDRKLPWRQLWPGAIVGGVGWWALQTFGTPLVSRAGSNETYGDFAAIIALMTFFFFAGELSLIAAELNAVLSRKLYPRSWVKGDLTVADVQAYELLATSTQRDLSYQLRLVSSDLAAPALNNDPVLDSQDTPASRAGRRTTANEVSR